ncbi:hypothetical protein ABFA07_002752 [Porites harrisoni]
MSDNIPLARQRQCADFTCEDEKYILDIFSCALPETHGQGASRKQVFVYITRAKENERLPFLEEEQTRLGMIRVYNDRFCWKKKKDEVLIVKMKMEDFDCFSKPIERRKIDEMRNPEKVTFTLPFCDASVMRFGMSFIAKFSNESVCGEALLETEYLKASFFPIPHQETRPGIEHGDMTSESAEQDVTVA